MSNNTAPVLFKHPFSRAYWKEAAGEFKKTKILVFAALMIALRVVMKMVSIPIGVDMRINTAFIVNAFGSAVFGPVVGLVAAAITDTLGCIFFPTGVYFFPFIFIEMAGSLCYALCINPDTLLSDSLPEDGFNDQMFLKLRSPRSIYCNTFYDWYFGCDDDLSDDMPVDLSTLPPIGIMGLDEEFVDARYSY